MRSATSTIPRWTQILALILFIPLFALTGALAYRYLSRPPNPLPAVRFAVPPPDGATLAPYEALAISPDARTLAFVASTADGRQLLWIRPLDSLTPRPLPGTEGATSPFWSPDSRFIGYFSQGVLNKIDASGGSPQPLCKADGLGGTWNRQGVILFGHMWDAIYRVPDTGGDPTPLTRLDPARKEVGHRWPSFLPDGRHFLYQARDPGQGVIAVGSLDSKETTLLFAADSKTDYAPPGYLLFVREQKLMAQAFDAKKLEVTGARAALAERVIASANGHAPLSVSDSGVLAYRSNSFGSLHHLEWFDRQGKSLGPIGPGVISFYFRDPEVAADGTRLVVADGNALMGHSILMMIDWANRMATRLSPERAIDIGPTWSPDGSRLVYASYTNGHYDLYQRPATLAGTAEVLLTSPEDKFPEDWSADGRFILYSTKSSSNTKYDLWVFPLFGEGKPIPLLQTLANERQARFSPDGRWIAYVSDESGKNQVYVQGFPLSDFKRQISTEGGVQPRWRSDGKELFFLDLNRRLMAVELSTDSTWQAGVPHVLFETRVAGLTDTRNHYAVAAGGQRFLLNTVMQESSSAPIIIVLNWAATLTK
jgi:Tol biopolymer transport system component